LALVLGLAPPLALGQQQEGQGAEASEQASAAEQYQELLDSAWGPASPQELEAYLSVREALLPIFEKYADGIVQWALREAGTRPMFGKGLMGVFRMRGEIDDQLENQPLDFGDYRRLTVLVYGRWLRAVREEAPPERSVARALQELELGLSRQLENNPPEDERERAQLADRLAAVRHHLRFIRHFAFSEQDKREILERIDAATREWLGAHRERVASLDFGVFDTAPPSRE
jgi:hypothetical protein